MKVLKYFQHQLIQKALSNTFLLEFVNFMTMCNHLFTF
jgi:hypothetical protein